jgi:hypothetical protein
MIRRALLIAALATGLSGCIQDIAPEAAGPYPDNYKDIVRSLVIIYFADPVSLRDVKISTPRALGGLFGSGWIVCVEANAKDFHGDYTGLRVRAFMISHGNGVTAPVYVAEDCLKNSTFSP